MDIWTILSVSLATIAVGSGVFVYTKLLKKRLRRYVLRYHKIKHYFEEERK